MDQNTRPIDTDAEIKEFVQKLIVEKGFPAMTDEVKKQVEEDLLNRLNDNINAKIVAALDDESIKEFSKLLDKNPSEKEVQEFVHSNIPDPANFMAKTLLDFRKVYLGLV